MSTKNKYLLIIILGIIMGIISGFSDFSISFMIFGSILIAGIISLTVLIIGIIKQNKLLNYGIVGFISILLFFISLKFTTKKIDNFRVNKTEKVIAKIEKFKSESGKIPEDLTVINSENELHTLEYSAEKNLNHFTIGYSIDGWNFKIYESRSKKWRIVD